MTRDLRHARAQQIVQMHDADRLLRHRSRSASVIFEELSSSSASLASVSR